MKVLTWNVNGLRAVLKNQAKDLRNFLDSLDADIICIQETKTTRDQLDSTTYNAQGYNAYFSFSRTKSGYSGVVTFCRDAVTPLRAEEGLCGEALGRRGDGVACYCASEVTLSQELQALDLEGRCVMTEHQVMEGSKHDLRGTLVVINVYCPRVDADNADRLEYQLKWFKALVGRCAAMRRAGRHVIVVGDFNCSIQPIDSAYAQEDPTLLDTPSRKYFLQFVHSQLCTLTGPQTSNSPFPDDQLVLLDVFRLLHPLRGGAYSWWHTVTDSRKVNFGKRIDLILCTEDLGGCALDSEVWQEVMGSDHCPVTASFSLTLGKSPKPPSLCSKYFVEFSGRQQTISSLWACLPAKRPAGDYDDGSHGDSSHGDSNHGDILPKMKASKVASGKKSIVSFFKQSTEGEKPVETSPTSSQGDVIQVDGFSFSEAPKPLDSQWRAVFSGPRQVVCSHGEPCVLRTAKKQGPNYNRQFYCCARPAGFKGDSSARCSFFMWATKYRKS